jgi:CDP-paratose 2-epimerase
MNTRPIVITGGAGFIGCNLADHLASSGHPIIIYDTLARAGVERNLDWLESGHGNRITHVAGDVRDEDELGRVASEAKAIFHMAAQVAVTTSLLDPREDFEINVKGTLNVLDAVRRTTRRIPVIFASTNKVYGDLGDLAIAARGNRYDPVDPRLRAGIGESRGLDFHTPYGCSKGAADQYVLDYCRSFDIPTVVFRMSCIYGERQMGTEDQGWVAHFLIRALEGSPLTIYGDGKQVRDILDVGDAVRAYAGALPRIDRISGTAFNLGGGPDNAVSLLELIDEIKTVLGRPIDLIFEDWRRGDQRWYVSNTQLVRRSLDLPRPLDWRRGVEKLATWIAHERGIELRQRQFASAAE